MQDKKPKPGPEPERLKLDSDWEEAAKKMLDKERPEEGWPKPEDDSGTPGTQNE